jgi:hypothetical protein
MFSKGSMAMPNIESFKNVGLTYLLIPAITLALDIFGQEAEKLTN